VPRGQREESLLVLFGEEYKTDCCCDEVFALGLDPATMQNIVKL
jgi:hypothetical protein